MSLHKKILRSVRNPSFRIFFSCLFIFTFVQMLRQQPDYQISNGREYVVIQRDHNFLDVQQPSAQCHVERRDFVYDKMIKCASETLASMFRRFGYHRNLSFVLPVGNKIYLGWPYQIQEDMYRHTDTNQFNILVDHAIYNKTTMKALMNLGAVFITSIREPFTQFTSMFNYYKLQKITGIPETMPDPISEYLHNLTYYEAKYTARGTKHRHCVPDGLHMSKNLMSFNLGFPTGFPPRSPDLSHDSQAVDDWLRDLEREFLLVMIVEYMDESLVLLKRLMCWNLKDILYQTRNSGTYTRTQALNTENYEIYKKWSSVDFRLYGHFTKVFWRKVYAQGPDFMQEVAHFKNINGQIKGFCDSRTHRTSDVFTVGKSQWNERFTFTREDCHLYNEQLTQQLKDKFNAQYPNIIQPKPGIPTC